MNYQKVLVKQIKFQLKTSYISKTIWIRLSILQFSWVIWVSVYKISCCCLSLLIFERHAAVINQLENETVITYIFGLRKKPQKCQEYDKLNSSFLSIQIAQKKIIEKYNNPIIEIMLNTINLIPVKKNRYTHKIMFYIKFTIDLENYSTL